MPKIEGKKNWGQFFFVDGTIRDCIFQKHS